MTKRGLILYLMGILVNFFGFFISHFVSGNLLGAWDVFPLVGGLLLFCVDILAFTCLAFVIIGIVKKIRAFKQKTDSDCSFYVNNRFTFKGIRFRHDVVNLIFANSLVPLEDLQHSHCLTGSYFQLWVMYGASIS